MRNYYYLLQALCLFILSSCVTSKQTQAQLHPILESARQTSLYAGQVDWGALDKEFKSSIGAGKTVEDLRPGLQLLANRLGDKHATFRHAQTFSILASYRGPSAPDNRRSDFVNTVINDRSAAFQYDFLEDTKTGYLRVVGIGPDKTIKEHADIIRNGLVKLKEKGAQNWILDLRYNGGGNMNPMLAGLAPLLGDGNIGGAQNEKGESVLTYQIKDGAFYNGDQLVCEMEDYPIIDSKEKVAVLLSRYTASSGELVAVAFKHRPFTRFIGEATAGFVTGNGYTPIHDEIIMMISETYFADRLNNAYQEKVEVDEEMMFDHSVNDLNDPQIIRALEWLIN